MKILSNGNRQFLKFFLVGGGQYTLDIVLFYIFLFYSIDIVVANLLSRAIVGNIGFIANRYITFKGNTVTLKKSYLKFLLAWIFTSIVSTVGILLLSSIFLTAENIKIETSIKMIVEIIVFIIAFFIQKLWIFKSNEIDYIK
jgi:putative flippase GtrA